MVKLLDKIFGTPEQRIFRKYDSLIRAINDLETEFSTFTDSQLELKTLEFRESLCQGTELGDLLPPAYAVVREVARRSLGQRPYDVQLLGGVVLDEGHIAEMKTGEGKTLVATLPCYLNALMGEGVHVITVNDYLARRDPVWMGPVYHMLGLSVGCLQHDSAYIYDPSVEESEHAYKHLRAVSRKEAYEADITYGTNNEFGFDYLRDNMALESAQQVQRGLNYAIVDEVDNILIDEARTPLIISGPAQEPVQLYYEMNSLAQRLRIEEDYVIDEKTRAISLTEEGINNIERFIKTDNLYSPDNYHLVQYIENAVRAHVLFKRDKEYVVRDGEVTIVDEFTGRLQPGRRWSDGLHQAIEAKEGLKVQRESVTYATITLQNYFRMYQKLAGMTGTAATESEEFLKIYGLDVVVIPTNVPMVRTDLDDLVYQTEEAKWKALCNTVKELHNQNKPVLLGTASIHSSERLSEFLGKLGVPHEVLNAKQHEREAQIISEAGRPGAVTVATNMAGRGTDIILGGNPGEFDTNREVWQKDHDFVAMNSGLVVIGTEHHEARRIDNQLRGRSGRQGDIGTTRFYASMEDEVVRRFGGEQAKSVMGRVSRWAGIDQDAPLESGMITKLIANAQTRVEGYHFEARKHLLEFDDVLNQQRENIYRERGRILDAVDLKTAVLQLVQDEISDCVEKYLGDRVREEWDFESLMADLETILAKDIDKQVRNRLFSLNRGGIVDNLSEHAALIYGQREKEIGCRDMRTIEQLVMLRSLDLHWIQHLTSIERLRQGVTLHAYAQKDPLVVYRMEGRRMYNQLLRQMRYDVVHSIYKVTLTPAGSTRNPVADAKVTTSPMASVSKKETVAVPVTKIGRNDPCYCGSQIKYKRCHGVSP